MGGVGFSRFDGVILFGLPDKPTRQKIAAQYARQLSEDEVAKLADVCAG